LPRSDATDESNSLKDVQAVWVSVFCGAYRATGIFRQWIGKESAYIVNISLFASLLLLAFLLLMYHPVADAHAVTGVFEKGCTKLVNTYMYSNLTKQHLYSVSLATMHFLERPSWLCCINKDIFLAHENI
jgi:hypothetical protein